MSYFLKETTRSGRVSKKKKYLHHLNEGEDESESDEDFSTESDLENEEGPKNTKKNSTLPLKKRGQASKMIDADMKRAIKAALDARPRVVPIGSLSSISDQVRKIQEFRFILPSENILHTGQE